MTWQAALRSRIKQDAGVAALCQQVDWTTRPQGSKMPAIVLTLVSDGRPQHLKGNQSIRQTRVQIDVLATTAVQKWALTEAVIKAIEGPFEQEGVQFARSFIDTVTDRSTSTDTAFVHVDKIDVLIWH